MDIDEFRRILKAGLGRAILHVRDHGDVPYRDIILDACLHGLHFDRQMEGERSWYLFTLIRLTEARDWYRARILAALRASAGDASLDADQLFALASRFAHAGNAEARQALYDALAAHVAARTDCAESGEAAALLPELDGIAGLLFVANLYGGWILDDPDAWLDMWIWPPEYAEDSLGKEHVAKALADAAKENPRIGAYIRYIERMRAEKRERSPAPALSWTYEQMLARVAEHAEHGAARLAHSDLQRWGAHASERDLRHAAAELMGESDPARLYPLISIFRRRTFPLAP